MAMTTLRNHIIQDISGKDRNVSYQSDPRQRREGMRKSGIIISIMVLIVSCNKSPSSPSSPIDTSGPIQFKTDSLVTGSYLGLSIGDSSKAIYARLQQMFKGDSIAYVAVVDNTLSDPSVLPYVVPLYRAVLCSDTTRFYCGMKFAFSGDSLESICHLEWIAKHEPNKNLALSVNNNGNLPFSWPSGIDSANAIHVGDNRINVALKLIALSANRNFNADLKRFTFDTKELSTPADSFIDRKSTRLNSSHH
jgi:hypothetical protein